MSPSDEAAGPAFTVVGGGAPTAEEVAAIAAALEVVLAADRQGAPPVSRWRWSGRRWGDARAEWRRPGLSEHPSRP